MWKSMRLQDMNRRDVVQFWFFHASWSMPERA